MKTYILLVLATMTGILIGWFLRGPDDQQVFGGWEVHEARSAVRYRGADLIESEERSSRSRGGSRHRGCETDDDEDDEEWLHVDPAMLTKLLNAKVVNLEVRTELVRADEPLSRFLRLDAEEVKELNELWQNISPKLHALRMENLKHQRLDDGGVWLGIESFPEQGDGLRQGFLLAIHGLLGEGRGKVFLDAVKAHGAYGQWGKTVGTGYVVRVRVQDDGSHLYEVIEQTRAGGTPGRRWQTSKIPAHLEDMAEEAGIALSP